MFGYGPAYDTAVAFSFGLLALVGQRKNNPVCTKCFVGTVGNVLTVMVIGRTKGLTKLYRKFVLK